MKARCPRCDELVGIGPTGEPIGPAGSARYWRVDVHKRPGMPALCDGGGAKI